MEASIGSITGGPHVGRPVCCSMIDMMLVFLNLLAMRSDVWAQFELRLSLRLVNQSTVVLFVR